MEKTKSSINIKKHLSSKYYTLNSPNQNQKTNNNPFVLKLLDKNYKTLKMEIDNKNILSNYISNKNLLKESRNSYLNTFNNPIKFQDNKMKFNLNIDKTKSNKNLKVKKHYSSDQIYGNEINKNKIKKKQLNIIPIQFKDSDNLFQYLKNEKEKNENIYQLSKNNSKTILNLKISKKNNFYNTTTRTNSNYIYEQTNSTICTFTSPQKTIFKSKKFSVGKNNNNHLNLGEEKISSITLSQENILNNNNKMIIQKRDNKKNFKLYKVYSNDNKNNNNNINLFNDLEKLKQRTKNILGAYLSYINNEN
jgi:hypothetical protein